MDSSGDILISVKPRHATSMMSGLKSVELRRRPINITPGTRVWIYSKLPQGQIQVLATVDKVVEDKPIKYGKPMVREAQYRKTNSTTILRVQNLAVLFYFEKLYH